ncbi:RDD family protein [Actinotalea solisilvae]|uniref:RDD family protein n=1 Tax=Actinotalea solisilvae TaxID=2072922 RepID=UPI0018F19B98|nr:RDD family protein [Actinotalea solisilvae]
MSSPVGTFCPTCHAPVTPGSSFCIRCGGVLQVREIAPDLGGGQQWGGRPAKDRRSRQAGVGAPPPPPAALQVVEADDRWRAVSAAPTAAPVGGALGPAFDGVEPAGTGRRVAAYAIDAAATALVAGAVWWFTGGLVYAGLVALEIAAGLVVWEARSGRTLGGSLLGLRSAQDDLPYAPGLARSIARAAVLGAGHLVGGVGQWLVLASSAFDASGRRQGWHDKLAGTVVVDVRALQREVAPVAFQGPVVTGADVPAPPPPPDAGVAPDRPSGPPSAPFAPPAPPVPSGSSPAASSTPPPPPVPAVPAPPTPAATTTPPPPPVPAVPAPPAAERSTRDVRTAASAAPAAAGVAPAAPSVPPPPSAPDAASAPDAVRVPDVAPTSDAAASPPPPPASAAPTAEPPRETPPPPAAASSYVVTLDDGRAMSVSGPGYVGRRPQAPAGERCDHVIEIEDPGRSLSRTHAAFGIDDQGFWIADNGSANGTWVVGADGTAVQGGTGERLRVPAGAIVRLGDRTLTVHPYG